MSRMWTCGSRRFRGLIAKHPDMECLGTEGVQKFWNNRWFLTGEEFKDGIAGAVNYFLPFDKLVNATHEMKQIMDRMTSRRTFSRCSPSRTGLNMSA